MKISIITPSYNSAEFIEDCIQSVLNQNYPNFEHIIIDGGSTDGTVEILKKYSHLKWVSEPDRGQSDALNKGFLMAQGELIGWLNADDYYLEGTFNRINNVFKKYRNIDIVYGNYFFIDKNKNILKAMYEIHANKNILIYYRCYIPTTALFFKRKVISKRTLLRIDFHQAMDNEWFIRLLTLGYRFKHIPYFMACFRWYEGNKSKRFKDFSPDWERIYQEYAYRPFKKEKYNKKLYTILRGYFKIFRGILKTFSMIYQKIFFGSK